MSLFDDDPFNDLFRDFFGRQPQGRSRRKSAVIRGEDDERTIDYIEQNGYVYLLFELPGFSEKEVEITITGRELTITAQKKNGEQVQGYLRQKLAQGVTLTRTLPEFVSTKKFTHTMKHGILEVIFARR